MLTPLPPVSAAMTASPGGDALLGPVEEEAPSPGADSSFSSERSDDSEPGMVLCMCACGVHVVCMWCACAHVCMYVCMCACVHACMCAFVHVCMHACVHVCMCACVHVCRRACVFLNMRMLCGSVTDIEGVRS